MGRRNSRIPRPLQPLLGGAVLVGAVRLIDVVWTRTTGRRPPQRTQSGTEGEGGSDVVDDAAPGVVRDRLLYALLLGGALRLARSAGLRDEDDPKEA
jgi:hypothetical protein